MRKGDEMGSGGVVLVTPSTQSVRYPYQIVSILF